MEAVASAKERGMLCLWQAVIEQIADPEAMRTNVLLARKLLGGGTTSRRQRKWDRAPALNPATPPVVSLNIPRTDTINVPVVAPSPR